MGLWGPEEEERGYFLTVPTAIYIVVSLSSD